MKQGTRIVFALVLGLIADFYSHLFLFPLLGKGQENGLIRYLVSISTVVLVAAIIWKLTAGLTKEHSSVVIKGCLIGALVGFVIGFAGPIIFMPGAPQGALLGIFFTIPIGFVVGMFAGLLYGRRKFRSV